MGHPFPKRTPVTQRQFEIMVAILASFVGSVANQVSFDENSRLVEWSNSRQRNLDTFGDLTGYADKSCKSMFNGAIAKAQWIWSDENPAGPGVIKFGPMNRQTVIGRPLASGSSSKSKKLPPPPPPSAPAIKRKASGRGRGKGKKKKTDSEDDIDGVKIEIEEENGDNVEQPPVNTRDDNDDDFIIRTDHLASSSGGNAVQGDENVGGTGEIPDENPGENSGGEIGGAGQALENLEEQSGKDSGNTDGGAGENLGDN